MATYDATIIATVADSLYAQAANAVVNYTAYGLVLGAPAGGFASSMMGEGFTILAMLIGGTIGAILGLAAGRNAALRLRFQAQQSLVLAEIERNTRPGTA